MRGKQVGYRRVALDIRIIPAHAGQTMCMADFCRSHTDHPRACGANLAGLQKRKLHVGSSPRMRGKHDGFQIAGLDGRIIPAHAGQTNACPYGKRSKPDHPRACGANALSAAVRSVISGSSPRMRGKQRGVRIGNGGVRIIPAHAGQTSANHVPLFFCSDHPRACGANAPMNMSRAR